MDLCLVFGDKAACMFYDRFHHCIVTSFILPRASIPRGWIGRTVDDLTTVCPPKASHLTSKFVKTYRQELERLNVGAAEEDPLKHKAFDGDTSGEVLGVWYDTKTMTWKLSNLKIASLVSLLLDAATPGFSLSLHDIEVIYGKLAHFCQLAHPLSLLSAEALQFMRELLERDSDLAGGKEAQSSCKFPVLHLMQHDLRTVASFIRSSLTDPLPVLLRVKSPSLAAVKVYTDISGHIISNPSLGIYIPSQRCEKPLVASLSFPRSFITAADERGKAVCSKTTMLEGLAFVTTLCVDTMRFIEEAIFYLTTVLLQLP